MSKAKKAAKLKRKQTAAEAKAHASKLKAQSAAAAKAAKLKRENGYNEQLSTLSPQQQTLQNQLIQQAQNQAGNLQPYNPQQGQQQQLQGEPQQQQQQGSPSYWDQAQQAAQGLGSYLTGNNPIAAAGSPLDQLYNHLTQTDYSKSGYQAPTNSGLGSLAGGLANAAQQYLPDHLKPYASQLSELANPSGPRDYGNPGIWDDVYNAATQTDYGKDQVTPESVNKGFAPYETQMRNNFYEGTVPGLAQRFVGLGGGRLGSPAFQKQLARAGRGIETDINAARETYRQGQQQYDLGNRQVGLQQRQNNKQNDISNRQIGLNQENQRQNFDLGNRQLGLNQEGQRFNQTFDQQGRAIQQNQFGQQLAQNQNQFQQSHALQQQEQQRLGQQQQFGQNYDIQRLAVNPNVENLYHAPQQSFGKQVGLGIINGVSNGLGSLAGRR